MTYGALTARNISADYFVEAVSGIGLVTSHGRTGGMPDYYNRLYPFSVYIKIYIFDLEKATRISHSCVEFYEMGSRRGNNSFGYQ